MVIRNEIAGFMGKKEQNIELEIEDVGDVSCANTLVVL
jgi:hypothetical protein